MNNIFDLSRLPASIVLLFHSRIPLSLFHMLNTGQVPQHFPENRPLGIWVNKQRMAKRAKDDGKSSSMTDDRVNLLEKVGFTWAKPKGQAYWEEKFLELQAFSEKNRHCKIYFDKSNCSRALYSWTFLKLLSNSRTHCSLYLSICQSIVYTKI